MGPKGWNIVVAVVAVLSFGPWAVYLAGLGKLTQSITDSKVSGALKQVIVMLEWYTVCAQFVNLVLILIACFMKGLRRTHSVFTMFLAVNAALLILRATERIVQINYLDDRVYTAEEIFKVAYIKGNPLKYLRAEACGQVASATMNFFLAILLGMAGTAEVENPMPPFAA